MSTEHARVEPAEAAFLGFPLSHWAFAFRTWTAMLVALYAAFWLQLENASSAAITVAILALPRRGLAFDKAAYRFGATLIGFVASLVIAALFAQSRDLYVVTFAAWMALAVYVASCFDGTAAYGAVLAGYTVSIIAVGQIDAPQNVFSYCISRVAVVSLGIASTALINDLFAAPDLYPTVHVRLKAAAEATRILVEAMLHGADPGPDRTVDVLRQIVGCRLDILSLYSENPSGGPRKEAAKSAAAALVASVSIARSYCLLKECLPRQVLPKAVLAADNTEPIATLLDAEMAKAQSSTDRVAVLDCLLRLAEARQLADHELQAMKAARSPQRHLALPIHRDHALARRAALSAFLTICAAAVFFIYSSWPGTAFALSEVGVFTGLSFANPNPRDFAKGALIAIPLATILAGVTEFLVLDGTDQFPVLAIGLAPAVFGCCLAIRDPRWGGVGFLALVYLPLLLRLSNPQRYSPSAYVLTACLTVAACIVFALLIQILHRTTDRDRRRWLVTAARQDLLRILTGQRYRPVAEATYLLADRIVALAQFEIGGPGGRKCRLAYTLLLLKLTITTARGLEALGELESRGLARRDIERARKAFTSLEPFQLRAAALALSCLALPGERRVRLEAACVIAALTFLAVSIETQASVLRHLRPALKPRPAYRRSS